MTMLEFMGDHPILTFFLAYVAAQVIEGIYKTPFRALNIWKHGWPPEHCDADGDLKPSDSEREA